MLETHLRGRGITNPDVLSAMEDVPRERFVDKAFYYNAYDDNPLPIGLGQTISQPYIVALMTQVLRPKPTDKVLEVGTGSGYQAAVISRIVERVYTIEIVKLLADEAAKRFRELGYDNIESRAGDGYGGWVEHAPFDKIIVTAAAPIVPKPLEEQLAEGGLLVMPVGGSYVQDLLLGEKRGGVVSYKNIAAVRFVPLTGKAEER
ncbi:MAG: protein-L-isoaspartate(D-aspartate) O-methyltransferase [Nitrospinae bacterium]|nr:protein-L-isoaspartate(D-aspartate) O-methyltransferase [Nitrospinota bacterium]